MKISSVAKYAAGLALGVTLLGTGLKHGVSKVRENTIGFTNSILIGKGIQLPEGSLCNITLDGSRGEISCKGVSHSVQQRLETLKNDKHVGIDEVLVDNRGLLASNTGFVLINPGKIK